MRRLTPVLLSLIPMAIFSMARSANSQCVDWSVNFRDPGGNGTDGAVTDMVVRSEPGGDRVYICGSFTRVGGVAARGVAVFDGTAWAPVGNWTLQGTPKAIEWFDDGSGPALYAAGSFNDFPTLSIQNFAKWTGSAWVGVGGGIGGLIRDMMAYDDGSGPSLWITGDIISVGNGLRTERIAAWTGASWRTWSAGPSDTLSLGFDAARGQGVLFTGNGSIGSSLGETWTWDGTQWTRSSATGPTTRDRARMVFDPIRQRLLMLGGNSDRSVTPPDTRNTLWAWDGSSWSVASVLPVEFLPTSGYELAFDAARDRLVIFGGSLGVGLQSGETWEWDGANWTRRTPAVSPPGRVAHAMAYDAVRQRVVMCGGTSSTQIIANETWEWDGTNWTNTPTPALGSLTGPSMVFDSVRGRVLTTGGSRNGGNPATDVWEWNGSAWTQIAPISSTSNSPEGPIVFDSARSTLLVRSHSPFAVARTALRASTATDWNTVRQGGFSSEPLNLVVHNDGGGNRLYAFGSFGLAQGLPVSRVARWDGQFWSPFSSMLFTSAEQLVSVPSGPAAGLWLRASDGMSGGPFKWNGTAWVSTPGPVNGFYFPADFGSGMRLACLGEFRYDAFNSINGTISTFDGTTWSPLDYDEPTARTSAAMAYDASRRRIVMFGGTSNGIASGAIAQTLEFDGRRWIPSASSGPSARYGHAMALDPLRSHVLCIGGQTSNGINTGETWSYNGTRWNLLAPSVAGTARFRAAVAWDARRERLVLFGGQTATGIAGDVREWDGVTWTIVPSGGPQARWKHAMAYDPVRQAVVMAGGEAADGSLLTDAWTWDGATWRQLTDGLGLVGGFMQFDESLGMVVANFSSALFPNGRFQSISRFGTPNARFVASAYDTTLNMHVLFGGTSLSSNGPAALRGSLVSFGNSMVSAPYRALDATRVVAYNGGSGQRFLFMGRIERPESRNLAGFGDSCQAPVILAQPQDAVGVFGRAVTLSVDAVGSPPLSFQWRRNGVPVLEIANIRTGATTAQLSFGTAWSYSDAGTYDCVVANPHGEVISNPIQFTVDGIGPSGPVTLSRVAAPGDPVPGRVGYAFDGFGSPLLSSTGDVVFGATFTNGSDPREGIVRWNAGAATLVAATGDRLPETEFSSTSVSPRPRVASAEGGIVFRSELRGSTITSPEYRNGLWFKSPSQGSLIARHGLEAPGTDGVFAYYSAFSPLANVSGELLMTNFIFGGGVMPENEVGVWSWSLNSGLTLVARKGSNAPGTTDVFSSVTGTAIAPDSTVYLSGVVSGVRGIWSGPAANPTLRLLGTQQAPGYAAGVTLNDIFAYAPTTAGRAMVLADVSLSGIQSALYRLEPSSLTLITRSGDSIPGRPTTDRFGTITPYASNTSGQSLFLANLACPSCGIQGLFLVQPNNAILPIAYANMPRPPGVPSLFTTVSIGSNAAINELGQVIMSGGTSAGSVAGAAVFGWTAASGLFAIATPGMQFQTAPGVYRTCSNAWITGPDPESSLTGNSLSLNDSGQVVLRLQFSDGSTGIWLGQFGDFLIGSFPCPTIFSSPNDQIAFAGQTRSFSVAAAASPPISYVWSLNGSMLNDSARVSGTRTPTLVIRDMALADAGLLRCTVSNPCSQSASAPFTLAVRCRSDFDDGSGSGTPDGGVTIDDLLYFLSVFGEGVVAADVDDGSGTGTPDGGVTIDDLLYFLVRYEAGC